MFGKVSFLPFWKKSGNKNAVKNIRVTVYRLELSYGRVYNDLQFPALAITTSLSVYNIWGMAQLCPSVS